MVVIRLLQLTATITAPMTRLGRAAQMSVRPLVIPATCNKDLLSSFSGISFVFA
jgi:hypothetical protein